MRFWDSSLIKYIESEGVSATSLLFLSTALFHIEPLASIELEPGRMGDQSVNVF